MVQKNRPSSVILLIGIAAAALGLAVVGGFFAWRTWLQPIVGGTTVPVAVVNTSGQSGGEVSMGGDSETISILLSEGKAQPQDATPVPIAEGEPMTADEIEAVLQRLPGFEGESGDQTDFRLALDPIPPPLTGDTVDEPFPPPEQPVQPDQSEAGPLEVLRYAPEGEIPIAPFVNITFSQPMVPLTTLEDLAIEDVPVQLEPVLPGTWRWLGTKTLTFEYDSSLVDRLPMATEYTVTIPAGTVSEIGGILAQDVTWSFSTPPPVVKVTYPYDEPQPLEPLFYILFDQRIDPTQVLETVTVEAGSKEVRLLLANEEDIQANKQVSRLVKNNPEGRWLAFKAQDALPEDTAIRVSIGPGTPSAEGPLVTTEVQSYSFRTYAPLRILDHGCSYGNDPCPPLSPFYIRFNNSIDLDVFTEGMLTISPELPGAAVNLYGDSLNIQGATKGRTTYSVTVSGEIQDIFGQKLGRDVRLSFRVGSANPMLQGPDNIFVTLDPAATKPTLSVYSINYNRLEVKMYAVQPSDWLAFKKYLQEFQRTDNPPSIPGKLLFDKTINVESQADTLTETAIDLSPALDGEYGQVIVQVAPPLALFQNKNERYWQMIHTWVQVTDIALDAFVDAGNMVAWATNLGDGSPLVNVTLSSGPQGRELGQTAEDGTARFQIPDGAAYLTGTKGSDTAMLPASTYYWGDDVWSSRRLGDYLAWYVFDDRQMYKPGEEMHVKGWLRQIGAGPGGGVGLAGNAVSSVSYSVTGPQGNEIGGGRADVNALGGFDFVYTLPEAVNLGYAQIYFTAVGLTGNLDNTSYYHSFQIQEFRRPEFEVSARNETTGPYFSGGFGVVAVEAKYYAGGPLPNADVTWQVTTSPGSYSPPNWSEFTFGIWEPWWWSYRVYSDTAEFYPPGNSGGQVEVFQGITDAAGEHYLRLDFDNLPEPRPYSIQAESTVMDVNRQAWTSGTNLLVHPADLYVGMRTERYFVERGEPLEVSLIVTDLDGNPVGDRPITVTAARLEWKYSQGQWREEEADVQTCTVGSTKEPVICTFETPLGGSYLIRSTVTDAQGRTNMSQFNRWVSGGQSPPSRKVEQEEATLIPDKESYQPGDVAEILVQSPFSPAEGLLTVTRSGIVYSETFMLEDGTATLRIPIKEAYIPNINIQVDLVGSAPRTDDQGETLKGVTARPAYAVGQLTLPIPPLARTMALEVTPQDTELEPGGVTTLDVKLVDADGQPVAGAELAVVVVDEAILALTNYQLQDPMSTFYPSRPSDLTGYYARQSILLVDPLALAQDVAQNVTVEKEALRSFAQDEAAMEAPAAAMPTMGAAVEEGMGGGAAQPEPIRVRTDFNPLAVFSPEVRTDANGKAAVEVKLPDNLTRYRIMVVAVDAGGQKFGSGEANLTARLPLMVRPSAPRFLNFGDQFELPVVLQNQTDEIMQVQVVVQGSNINLIDAQNGAAGKLVTVPARDRVEVRFAAATIRAGTARFQIAAVSGTFADAATVELPVYTPATTEAFATYGVVDEGATFQPVSAPEDVFPQYGGLEITTSSTALQALTDAVLYLVSYPYDCTEQIASRILAVAALRDVLTAFEADGLPSPDEMEASVSHDIERLQGLQNYDGGFPYWRRGFDSIPFNSIHVAHALVRAKQKGFEVPEDMQQRLLDHLRDIESYYPSWYSQRIRWTLSSYALYVRSLMGDRDPAKARSVLNEAGLENLDLEAVGWLWSVLQDDSASTEEVTAIRVHVNNRVVETPGAANFTTFYDDQSYLLLSSDRRTDAILLDALIGDNPDSDLIPKVVNGLLAHRTRGRWGNTQENVFVLLALDRYFNTFESQTPDFVARIWLGDTYAGSHTYEGRTTERHQTDIPMAYLVDPALGGGETQNLVLEKDGQGRLYYRLGLRYAPTDLQLDPLDMGFVVQRMYEAVDDPEDVSRDEDGVWHIRAGARVRVRLTMVAANRRYHVALVDPLPAGLEIVNPSLAVSGSVPQDPGGSNYRYGWWWWGTWYEHQNLRDERAEAFTSLLWDGVYEYTYIARATTPGTFVVPPAKAEEMYSPEVFGRSASDLVIVEDK